MEAYHYFNPSDKGGMVEVLCTLNLHISLQYTLTFSINRFQSKIKASSIVGQEFRHEIKSIALVIMQPAQKTITSTEE
jgi:hypothetical protein